MTFRLVLAGCLVSGGVLAAYTDISLPDEGPVSVTTRQQPQGQQPREIGISLNNPGGNPKIGLPDFVAPDGDAELVAAARTTAEVLWADLDFEKEFYMIDRQASASIPVAATPEAIAMDRWRDLGADFVVYAVVRRSATPGEFAVDLKIVTMRGTTAGQFDFIANYDHCTLKNARWCAHSIADNLHKEKRGLDGVARTKLAFVSDRDNRAAAGRQVKEIYVSDYDGADQRAVTAHRNLSMMPAWAPDGVSLAYVSYYLGFNEIFLTRPDGRPATRPAGGDPDRRNLNPAISPDGKKMLFTSGRDSAKGFYDVFVVNIDGTGLRNLTPNTPESGESAPAWNPTGTMIAFTSDRTGTNQIWLMTPEGLNQQRIPTDTHCDRPTWSLQNFIAFSYGPANSQKHDIALYDLQSARLVILTDGVGNNGSPAVAPNGRHVVFNTTRWGTEQLAVVSRTGGPPKKLTELGNNTYPNWSSPPR